jgi:hypothetical protein
VAWRFLFRDCIFQVVHHDEAPLTIQAQGSLPFPGSPQLLEVQALERIEVVWPGGCADDLEDLEECGHDRGGIPLGSCPRRVESLQFL